MISLAHSSIIFSRDSLADALVALDERLLIDLRSKTAVWNLIEVIDVQSVAAHAHMIHSHEFQHTHAPFRLLHHVGRDVVDVALAESGIALEMLHVATVLKPGGRHKHRELLGLELLELLCRQIGLQSLAVVDCALAQRLVVPDFVVDLTESDVVVHQCTETIGIHG